MPAFTLTIDDQDALDAIDHIIQANGLGEKPEDVIGGMLVPQLIEMRGQQLMSAAQAAAVNDPNVLAFQKRQVDKLVKDEPAEISPIAMVQP